MDTSQTNGNGNPYAYPIPHGWADIYAERRMQSQLFPGTDPNAVLYDRSNQQFVIDPNTLNHTTSLQVSRSLTPQPTSTRTNISALARPQTPQPIGSHGVPSQSSSGQLAPLKAQSTSQMAQSAKIFRDAVTEFKKSSKATITLDLDNAGTWDDLLQDVDKIKEIYKSGKTKSGTFSTMLRKGFRNMAKCQSGVQSWLRLLPGDSWQASLIIGGIRIIFDAAAKLDSMREETYDILEQIPQTLANADRLARYYLNADSLHQYVSQLYVSVIDTLCVVVSWYQQSSARHVISAMAKGSGYGRRLRECLENLQRIGESVTKQGNVEMHGQIHNMTGTLNDVSGNVLHSQNLLAMMCAGMNSQTDILRDQELIFNTLITELRSLQLEREEERQRKLQVQVENQRRNERYRTHILNRIEYDPDVLLLDLQRVLQTGLAFDRTRQGYATSILHSEQVGIWLGTNVRVPLIVNAHLTQHDRISTVSLFSCMLVRLLERLKSGLVLSWFCGLHTETNECTSMLLNFMGQLLCSAGFNPEILNENFEYFAQSLLQYPPNLAALASAVRILIKRQLAYSQVIMVIDSISFYESHTIYQEMAYTLQTLSSLCPESAASTHTFKLIVTSPKVVKDLADVIEGSSGRETLDLAPLRLQNASRYQSTMQTILS